MLWCTVVDCDPDQIYRALLPVEGDVDGVSFFKWQVQVSCQQVAGASRYQPQRNPGAGQTVGDGADCAVPAGTNNKINLLCDGLSGHGAAGILGRGLQPQGVAPAVSLEAVLHQGVKLVADLGWVIDDRAAAPALVCLLKRCHVGFLNRLVRCPLVHDCAPRCGDV